MKKITAYGEVLFDVYPDAKTLGGAPFNFLYHINKFTGNGRFISCVGKDALGEEIINFMKFNAISTEYIMVDSNHPTGAAIANLDENKIPHWEIKNNCAYDFINVSDKVAELLEKESGCLYFGTLARRNEVSDNSLKRLFGKNIKYFCDLNLRQNFYSREILISSLENADVLKLNNDELEVINNMILKEPYNEADLAKRISDKFDIELVCVTMGDRGAYLYGGGKVDHYMARAEKVIDTVGAGDAYASILCLGCLEGWEISQINKAASEFAAAIVGVKGALPDNDGIYDVFKKILQTG